ncbi:MAG TPA: response regulator [Kofleriaceae bacterium]|nr:response regulator [Kofleriaceae bacterium]
MGRILVVDDEADVVRTVTKALEARGHTITIARDGAEAIAAVAENRPDLLVIDLAIPKIDGAEVARRLKADPATRAVPILMMSASYLAMEAVAEGQGADEFVVKPFLRDTLVKQVERLLAKRA